MTDLITIRGTDGKEHQIPVAAMDAIVKRQRHSHRLKIEAYEERIEKLEAVVKRIPNMASYVVATLHGAAHSDEEWGEVHRGRAGSSIRQLKSLGDQAAEAINEEAA